jgi:hypothetical protein
MRLRLKLVPCVASLALAAFAVPAAAETEVKTLGRFGDWSAYTYQENGRPVCYMSSSPVKRRGTVAKRGDAYFLVTHRPEFNDVGVVTVVAGYAFQPDSTTTVAIGKARFTLFTRNETAWANGNDDGNMVRQMKRGNTLIVTGKAKSGIATTDLYSLAGFSKAYDAISKSCKVRD